ncbi:hypothetical protein [Streptomyces sp. GS7]|uniref:hypothetical protein n=1 Tax=Streptomyces sp. GS7 TaxID=2692234 RepID=UPI0013175255|nr:hypothetical protein [Streptomyces sp. GS7]QHC26310.1 hypothetical protein GR130_38015 [Streptomyces sp. GS7]
MSEPHGGERETASHEEILRKQHAARGRSAIDRATALCRFVGIADDDARAVPTSPTAKAASAVRLSARALAHASELPPDPAADARCARNAAAAAAVAAKVAQSHAGPGDLADAAYRAAVSASLAGGYAAGQPAMGRDEALNRKADADEAAAVAAAEAAGWM